MSRHRPDLSAERGIALLVVILALAAGSTLGAVVLSAAGADLPFARVSQERKQAYAAAEAGLVYYMFKLGEFNDYWTLCDHGRRRARPSRTPSTSSGTGRELDGSRGTFRLRATGRSGGVTRTIVTTLRRRSFLDFIYFTDYETRASRPAGCVPIQFVEDDEISGPLHTNDDLLTCGQVKFGRDADDKIEASGPAGWTPASGCSGRPNFQGRGSRTPIRSMCHRRTPAWRTSRRPPTPTRAGRRSRTTSTTTGSAIAARRSSSTRCRRPGR